MVERLRKTLKKIDQKGYKAYKEIQGKYQFSSFTFFIDHVQGDPFASPSKIRVVVPRNRTEIKAKWTDQKYRKICCEDFIARKVHKELIGLQNRIKGSGKSGVIMIDRPNQKVIERTAVQISDQFITICLSVGLPAHGRRILGKEAEKIFFCIIPEMLKKSVYDIREKDIQRSVYLMDQQQTIRQYMKKNGLISFIANGAILPRESGISDKPLKKGVIPFRSPKELEISIPVPHRNTPITGMAIRKGITLIVGGGYHGKSTLLKAIEQGVYNHIEGDGREFVLTDETAVKIRAEDGRSISKVDISPFIGKLPYGKDTKYFTTENASGSTSQAANIIEMMEAGAKTLLIDEDTSATNFMIRDFLMQELIAKKSEPITPFIDKVDLLKQDYDISTILVMGGSGDYFRVADCVIKVEEYLPYDVTKEAKRIAKANPISRKNEGGHQFGIIQERIPLANSLNAQKGNKHKINVRGRYHIQYGKSDIHLLHVEQLIDDSQTRMIAEILFYLERNNILSKKMNVQQILNFIEEKIEKEGLNSISSHKGHPGELARPRRYEIAAAFNRLRTLKCI